MSQQEFIVRVPKETKKRYHVMRFNKALNVNVDDWQIKKINCKMERENNQREMKAEADSPKFGAGSEFGKQQREEAKRKKYGGHSKKYNPNDQPWLLKVGSGKHARRYKGVKEGGVSENTSYYVFFQAPDGAFEAFPIEDWYNFTTINRYKPLSFEEAEERFAERNKILNYFSVMSKRKDDENQEGGEVKVKSERRFKVSDLDEIEWQDFEDSDNERENQDDDDDDGLGSKGKKKGKGKGKGKQKTKQKKKKKANSSDSEPVEESDEGDFDQLEVDYMSSSSSSESEHEETRDTLRGVEDEDGLRQLALTDDEEEEEGEKDKNQEENEKTEEKSKDDTVKIKIEKDTTGDSPPPSSSDSDDSDLDESKSALFMQKKTITKSSKNGSDSAQNSRSATPTMVTDSPGTSKGDSTKNKRKISSSDLPSIKRPKLSQDLNNSTEGISEEAVRRYLIRKPMTTKDLLQKFKNRVNSKEELVQSIALILKRLNPEKQMIKGKMYLSLKQ